MNVAEISSERVVDEAAVAAIQQRLALQPTAPWLHIEVARRMVERLVLFRAPPRSIVDWWSFLGASARMLTTAHPKAALIAVEPSGALMSRSQQALSAPWWRVRPWATQAVVVAQTGALPTNVQLVWANMALHFVKDPPALMAQWSRMLSAGGFVMFSCFGPDTLRELRALYSHLRWPAPTIDFVDMHDLGDMLLHAGFVDPVMDQESLTIHWDTPQALCDDLRLLGGNASPLRFQGLRTRHWRASLHNALSDLRDANGRLSLTFEIVYGHAFKAEPAATRSNETHVSIEEMRKLLPSAGKSA